MQRRSRCVLTVCWLKNIQSGVQDQGGIVWTSCVLCCSDETLAGEKWLNTRISMWLSTPSPGSNGVSSDKDCRNMGKWSCQIVRKGGKCTQKKTSKSKLLTVCLTCILNFSSHNSVLISVEIYKKVPWRRFFSPFHLSYAVQLIYVVIKPNLSCRGSEETRETTVT